MDGSATPPAQVLQLKVIADSPIKRPSHVDAQFALDPEREGGDIRRHRVDIQPAGNPGRALRGGTRVRGLVGAVEV